MEEQGSSGLYYNRDIRPIPDPTVLTTQQLMRELAALQSLLESRLDGMDKAIELVQVSQDKYPDFVRAEVAHLQRLHEEKFATVQVQFAAMRDTVLVAVETAKSAVALALDGVKDAAQETKASFTKQIDQLATLLRTITDATGKDVSALTQRVTTVEGRSSGMASSWGVILGALGGISVIVSIGMMLYGMKR